MDIEQLKLILETVGEASEGASTIAMIYLLKGYFSSILSSGVILFVIHRVSKMVGGFFFYGVLQSHIGVTPDYQLVKSEKREILELLEDGKKYRNKKD